MSERQSAEILLVNDDGVEARGLWVLFDHVEAIGKPIVVAPAREQSARSHAVTIRRAMALQPIIRGGVEVGYSLDGTPADCVKLALAELYRDRIDLVISGINWGSNVGHNILYSGTVAAAMEAAMYGLPALAVSLRDDKDSPQHIETAAIVACRVAADILANGLPRGVILNVNVPDVPIEKIERAVLTRQGEESFIDIFEFGRTEDGGRWCANVGGERLQSSARDDPLDDLALNEGCVSITPLQFNLTSQEAMEQLGERVGRLVFPGAAEGTQ